MKYELAGETVKDTYMDVHYSLEELPDLLNQLYNGMMITRRDIEHCLELKAINRHLKMENRFLTIKLQQLAFHGRLNIKDIENELKELCLNPNEASRYIHNFEKENYELKKKLKELGEYSGDLL